MPRLSNDDINQLTSFTEVRTTEPTALVAISFDYNYGKDGIVVTIDAKDPTTIGYILTMPNETTVAFSPPVPTGHTIRLQRETDIDKMGYIFTSGALFIASNMDANFEQIRHSQQEVKDSFDFLENTTLGVVEAAKEATARANEASQKVDDALEGIGSTVPHNWLACRDVPNTHPATSISYGTTTVGNFLDSLVYAGKSFVTDDYSTLSQLQANDGQLAFVKADGLAGEFKYRATSAVQENGGTIIASTHGGNWVRINYNLVTLEMFGGGNANSDQDTTALEKAVATGSSIFLNAKSYYITRNITISTIGQSIFGSGLSSTLYTSSGITLSYLNGNNKLLGGVLQNFAINASGMPSGYAVSILGGQNIELGNLWIYDSWNQVYVKQVNTCTLTNVTAQGARGDRSLYLDGTQYRSDLIRLNNCIFTGGTSDSNGVATANSPLGAVIEGYIDTVQADDLVLLVHKKGLVTLAKTQATAIGDYTAGATHSPNFLRINGIEIDYPYEQGLFLDAGNDINISMPYINTAKTQQAIVVGNNAAGINILEPRVTGSFLSNVYIAGMNVNIVGGSLYMPSYLNSTRLPNVDIAPTAKNICISGVNMGEYDLNNQSITANYAVNVQSGAKDVSVTGGVLKGIAYAYNIEGNPVVDRIKIKGFVGNAPDSDIATSYSAISSGATRNINMKYSKYVFISETATLANLNIVLPDITAIKNTYNSRYNLTLVFQQAITILNLSTPDGSAIYGLGTQGIISVTNQSKLNLELRTDGSGNWFITK